jgi:hypothetical protein
LLRAWNKLQERRRDHPPPVNGTGKKNSKAIRFAYHDDLVALWSENKNQSGRMSLWNLSYIFIPNCCSRRNSARFGVRSNHTVQCWIVFFPGVEAGVGNKLPLTSSVKASSWFQNDLDLL